MGNFIQDLRYCLRMLRKRPPFTIVAVVTLALGIGASTALFSIVNIVILNPFPYNDPAKLFFIRQSLPKIGVQQQFRASGPEFVDLAQSGIFERVAAYEAVSRNLTGGEEPERVPAGKVSTEFFSMLGVEPELGRTIQPEEQGPNGARVLVISHALWQRRFGGERTVLGQKVFLDDEPFTIVGVMPPRFRYDGAEAWFPFPFDFAQAPRGGRQVAVLVRTKLEKTAEQTKAELATLARQNEQAFATTNPEYAGRGIYLESLSEFYFGVVRKALFVLLGAVGLVLLIACANIANLLLARSMGRSHEIAVRAAMGANRLRIIRQMLTESAVLALLGGVSGLLLASWGTKALVTLIPTGTIPPGREVGMNARVLLFALAVSLVTAFIFGLWPALQISRAPVQDALKSGNQRSVTRAPRRAQNLLVVAEVSLSLILLVMAGLMIRSYAKLTNIDPGLNTANVLSMRINRSPAKSKDGAQNALFFQQVIDRVKSLPGIEAVSVASHMPFVFTEAWPLTIESNVIREEMQTQSVDTRTISSDYFTTMGIPLLAGQFFSIQDGAESQPVIIINQAMANRFWVNQDPLGKRIKIADPEPGSRAGAAASADSKNPWFTVKGVVRDSAQASLDVGVKPEVYFPLGQMAGRYRRMNLAVRSTVDPKSLVGSIQRAIREVDSNQPVYQIQTMEDLVGDSVGTRRFALLILIMFASLALVLAATGIYGVLSYSVAQRTREIGIRVALGARAMDVLRLVVGQCMRLAVAGVGIGLVAALALTRLMTSLLFGVTATDATTFIAVSLSLLVVALLACYIPARRATRVDPLVALRYE
ncbi:MAG: ABC transporter permease [Pyrinomonadaceae bacterium]